MGNYTDDDGAARPRHWGNGFWHFDHIGGALLLLFELSTLELWPHMQLACIDATPPGQPPQRDANPLAAVYYALAVLFCSFFVVNLFVGVILDKFAEIKSEKNGAALLSPGQKKWVDTQRLILRTRPRLRPVPPARAGRARRALFCLARSWQLEVVVMIVIVANMVTMALYHWDQPAAFEHALTVANRVFLAFFVLEAAVKVGGLGWQQYYASGWNRFDLVVVLLSVLEQVVRLTLGSAVDVSALRALRAVRVLRLVSGSKGLRALAQTFLLSLPSLANVGALLLLVYFVFAVAGVHLFGGVAADGDFHDRTANFHNFWFALLTLFRTATGEDWNGIMLEIQPHKPYTVAPFFVLFVVVGQYVILSLFIAVILDNFSESSDDGVRAVRTLTCGHAQRAAHALHCVAGHGAARALAGVCGGVGALRGQRTALPATRALLALLRPPSPLLTAFPPRARKRTAVPRGPCRTGSTTSPPSCAACRRRWVSRACPPCSTHITCCTLCAS